MFWPMAGLIWLVIRQKGESQNGCFKKTKYAKFFVKQTFLTPWYAHLLLFPAMPQLSLLVNDKAEGVKKCHFESHILFEWYLLKYALFATAITIGNLISYYSANPGISLWVIADQISYCYSSSK